MKQPTPTPTQIRDALRAAERSVTHARDTRRRYRRRHTKLRDEHLRAARKRCAESAAPLRSYIGMVAWHNLSAEDELAMKRQVAELRYERRQIDKML